MSDKMLSHGRLLTRFAQIGPYLRKDKCKDGHYFFDCLSSCVNAKKAPEHREFWGWWLKLKNTEQGFECHYQFGKYDLEGKWVLESPPTKNHQEVQLTLDDFRKKISQFIEDELQQSLQIVETAN